MLTALIAFGALAYVFVLLTSLAIGLSASPTYFQYATADDRVYCSANAALFAGSSEAAIFAEQTGGSALDGSGACLYYVGVERYNESHHAIPSLRPSVAASSRSALSFGAQIVAPVVQFEGLIIQRFSGGAERSSHGYIPANARLAITDIPGDFIIHFGAGT